MTRIEIKEEDFEIELKIGSALDYAIIKFRRVFMGSLNKGIREEAEQLKSQILQDQEKAKKWDNQKYIYEQNFEKNTLDLTQEEYEKSNRLQQMP